MLVDNVGSTALDQVGCVGPRDAVLAVSFSPYNSITPDLVAMARDRDAGIAAITDSTFSPLVKLADACIEVVESDFAGFRSLAASLAVGMALVQGVVARRERNASIDWREASFHAGGNRNFVPGRRRVEARVDGKVALVTGATQGVGRAVAEALAAAGAAGLLLTGRDPAAASAAPPTSRRPARPRPSWPPTSPTPRRPARLVGGLPRPLRPHRRPGERRRADRPRLGRRRPASTTGRRSSPSTPARRSS